MDHPPAVGDATRRIVDTRFHYSFTIALNYLVIVLPIVQENNL